MRYIQKNTLLIDLPFTLNLSASSRIVRTLQRAILTFQFIHLFQIGFSCLISLQYRLSFANFSLGLNSAILIYISHTFWQQKPMLLKRKVNEPRANITNVINPYMRMKA